MPRPRLRRLRQRLVPDQRMRDFGHRAWPAGQPQLPQPTPKRRLRCVWNVVAPELSLTQLRTWCFPLVGCVWLPRLPLQPQGANDALAANAPGLEETVYTACHSWHALGKTDWLGGDLPTSPWAGSGWRG